MSKAKQILLDLNKELQGQLLSDTFVVEGTEYEMKLLGDAESAWTYGLVNSANTIVLTITARLANLSAGIRRIGGCEISEIFEDDIIEIEAKRKKIYEDFDKLKTEEVEELGKCLKPYEGLSGRQLECKLLLDWLGEQPSSYVDSLFKKWTELVKRQEAMQESVKKSSQGNSENNTQTSSTEPSPNGENSVQE